MSAEPCRQARDGARRTTKRTGQLSMGRAGEQSGSDGTGQIAALQIVRDGERLLREGAQAAAATEPRNDAPITLADEHAMPTELKGDGTRVRPTTPPRTMRRPELLRGDSLDGSNGPMHARHGRKTRAGSDPAKGGLSGPLSWQRSVSGHLDVRPRTLPLPQWAQHSAHHHGLEQCGPIRQQTLQILSEDYHFLQCKLHPNFYHIEHTR